MAATTIQPQLSAGSQQHAPPPEKVAAAGSTAASSSSLQLSMHGDHVLVVKLNRPTKRNAMTSTTFLEIGQLFEDLSTHVQSSEVAELTSASYPFAGKDVRSVVLAATGPCFSSGIDIAALAAFAVMDVEDPARKGVRVRHAISHMQRAFTYVAECPIPVIAAVQGACLGAGVDLLCAADIRWCTADAFFSVKEVDLGLPADLGTLQRLPAIVGSQGLVREWCYTGRNVPSTEALLSGLVTKVFPTGKELMEAALSLATLIATKSPTAIHGTKEGLNYNVRARIQRGLDNMAVLNASLLQSDDATKAVKAAIAKAKGKEGTKSSYSKL